METVTTMPLRDKNAEAARRLALRQRALQRIRELRAARALSPVAIPSPFPRGQRFPEAAPQRGFAQRVGEAVQEFPITTMREGPRVREAVGFARGLGAEAASFFSKVVMRGQRVGGDGEGFEPRTGAEVAGQALARGFGLAGPNAPPLEPWEAALIAATGGAAGIATGGKLAMAQARMAAQRAGQLAERGVGKVVTAGVRPVEAAPDWNVTLQRSQKLPFREKAELYETEFKVTARTKVQAAKKVKEGFGGKVISVERAAAPVTKKPPVAPAPSVQPPTMKPTEAVGAPAPAGVVPPKGGRPTPTAEGVVAPPVKAPTPAVAWETGQPRPFAFDPNSTANQGRFRLLPPVTEKGRYITRQSTTPGVSYIVDTKSNAIQSVRFDKGKFTEAQAAKWWEANKSRFEFAEAKPGLPLSVAKGRAKRPAAAPVRPAEAPGAALPPEGPPPTLTGAVPPGQGPRDPNELVQALAKAIRGAKRPLAVKEAAVSRELGKRAAKAQARLQAGDRIGARAAFVGELPDAADILPISREFTAADGQTLRNMITQKYSTGDLGDSFRFMQTDTAFTKLWDKGQIPTRSELVALEEVFGKPFVEAVLSLRRMPLKAWELFLELWNTPRAMLASGDISASARQAAPFIFTGKGKPWLDAFEAQLKAWKSEAGALASVQRIAEHPLYAASQRAGLDLTIAGTLRRAAVVTAREEPFIGARLLAKIPIYGRVIRASERAYVTMLNEVRFSTFVREAEKLGAGATTGQLRDIASAINILSGRAPLGKFAQASTILNGIFFAPRFALSRVMAPTTLITGSAPSRKMVARMLVSYVSTVTGMLFLADLSGAAEVEWNPLSADLGKARFGNIRVDPWAGLQQPVVLAARLATGKTKQLSTGQVKELDAGRAIWQFLTSKLQPSPRVVLKRGEGFAGEAPLEPSPIPRVPRIVFDNFVFIFVQDILEAYAEAGPKGLFTAPLSILGVGVQTFRTGMSLEREKRLRSALGPQVETTLATLDKLRIDIGEVGKKLDIELGVKGGEVDLTPAQRDALQALTDEIVIGELQTLFAHPTFQAYLEEEKKEAAKEWIESGRAAAREQFRATLGSQAAPEGRKAVPAQAPAAPIAPGQSYGDALRQRVLERARELRRERELQPVR